jgi:hypothetical protein
VVSVRSIGWLTIAAVVVALRPTPARACSCDFYRPGNYYVGADGRLPRDAPGIPWYGTDRLLFLEDPPRPLSTRVSLRRTVDGRSEVVPFTVVERGRIDIIVPDGGLRAGDAYTVMVREYWNDSPLRRSYRPKKYWSKWERRAYAKPPELHDMLEVAVTVRDEPAELRGAELQLSARAQKVVGFIDQRTAACGVDHLADTIDLTVMLPPALEPYREYFLYETRVDGEVFAQRGSKCSVVPPGRSWTEKLGTDRVFSECGEQIAGLTPGEHRVAVTISTPDGARSFTTPEVEFLLGCGVPDPPDPPPVAPAEPPAERPAEPPPEVQGPPPAAPPRGCAIGGPAWGWPLASLLIRRRRGGPGGARTPRPRG